MDAKQTERCAKALYHARMGWVFTDAVMREASWEVAKSAALTNVFKPGGKSICEDMTEQATAVANVALHPIRLIVEEWRRADPDGKNEMLAKLEEALR